MKMHTKDQLKVGDKVLIKYSGNAKIFYQTRARIEELKIYGNRGNFSVNYIVKPDLHIQSSITNFDGTVEFSRNWLMLISSSKNLHKYIIKQNYGIL